MLLKKCLSATVGILCCFSLSYRLYLCHLCYRLLSRACALMICTLFISFTLSLYSLYSFYFLLLLFFSFSCLSFSLSLFLFSLCFCIIVRIPQLFPQEFHRFFHSPATLDTQKECRNCGKIVDTHNFFTLAL